ncbi:MAG: family transporter [Caloramator sp.]|jgi:predicted PurR-regulated permease PerM|uniref:AI-2E family transporter n=1 Tax=Caloramator sp. TaxID=1871330 RepID=UPI001D1BBC6A|nr:AI-2E family transporter [Caloramator sp.]MBZ4662451.1 family transporter [Caloramator sp.]
MINKKTFIVYFIFFILFVLSLYLIKDLLKPIIVSIIFAYILYPIKRHLEKRGFSSKLAALVSLIFIIILIIFVFLVIVPSIIKEIFIIASSIDIIEDTLKRYFIFLNRIPAYLKGNIEILLNKIKNNITLYLDKIFVNTIVVSKKVPLFLLTPIFTYYFLIDTDYFKKQVVNIVPAKFRLALFELAKDIDEIIGKYVKGQLILSIIISVFTFIGLVMLKIRFPLFIAIINGFTNIIPYFGPVLGFIPALVIALTESINKAIIVTIFFFIIQEVESSIIAPKILGDSLGIHPVYIIIILLIGGKFFGGIGLLLAVPIAGIIKVTYNYLLKKIF